MKIMTPKVLWKTLQRTAIEIETMKKFGGVYTEDEKEAEDYAFQLLVSVAGLSSDEVDMVIENAVIRVAEDLGFANLTEREADNHYWKSHEEINDYCMRGF